MAQHLNAKLAQIWGTRIPAEAPRCVDFFIPMWQCDRARCSLHGLELWELNWMYQEHFRRGRSYPIRSTSTHFWLLLCWFAGVTHDSHDINFLVCQTMAGLPLDAVVAYLRTGLPAGGERGGGCSPTYCPLP